MSLKANLNSRKLFNTETGGTNSPHDACRFNSYCALATVGDFVSVHSGLHVSTRFWDVNIAHTNRAGLGLLYSLELDLISQVMSGSAQILVGSELFFD